MSTSVQTTLIICITLIILNLIWFKKGKLEEEAKSTFPPKPNLPPRPIVTK